MKLIFKFSGGPLDGKTIVDEPGAAGEAHRYYALSYHGRVGQRFRTISEYAVRVLSKTGLSNDRRHFFQPHYYQVTDRIDNGDILVVRTQYVVAG